MVRLTEYFFARKPLLIYGVKRGIIPTKLRPRILPRGTKETNASCIEEMNGMTNCWKDNSYDDIVCSNEVEAFMKCAYVAMKKRYEGKGKEGWTLEEINAALRIYSPYENRPRAHSKYDSI